MLCDPFLCDFTLLIFLVVIYFVYRGLTWHWLSCTIHKQSFVSRRMLPPTLPCSAPSSTWAWIASIDIINVFHLGLSRPCFYHHIPYAFRVDVQQTLHIPLFQLTSDPSDVVTWHFFCYSLLGVCLFLHMVVKKATERLAFAYVNTWVVIGKHYRRNTRLEHSFKLLVDVWNHLQILPHIHQHNYTTHGPLLM